MEILSARRAQLLILALALVTFACGSPSNPSGTGSLNVRLTDSPFTEAEAVLVTFSEVAAHRSEGDSTRIQFEGGATRTCDLKRLEQGADDLLAGGTLLAGQYTMVRLVVQSAKVYFEDPSDTQLYPTACAASMTINAADGTWANVQIPSGEVKLNRPFTIEAETATTMQLDFDGDHSIHLTGNDVYTMSPVIAILSVTPAQAAQ